MSMPDELVPIDDQVAQILCALHRFGDWAARRAVEQDCRCIYCGRDLVRSFDDYQAWEFDHVIPASGGGSHSFENVVVCCRPCNYLKLDYAPSGATHEERVHDAAAYIKAKRDEREGVVSAVRELVRSRRRQALESSVVAV
jgi:5-methylcytosine-specific restriction endonuclease McrA